MLVDRQTQTWTKFKYLIDIVEGRLLYYPIAVSLKGNNEVGECQNATVHFVYNFVLNYCAYEQYKRH